MLEFGCQQETSYTQTWQILLVQVVDRALERAVEESDCQVEGLRHIGLLVGEPLEAPDPVRAVTLRDSVLGKLSTMASQCEIVGECLF